MVEGGASQSFMGIARRFSRRGLLGTIGIGAAAGVAIASSGQFRDAIAIGMHATQSPS